MNTLLKESLQTVLDLAYQGIDDYHDDPEEHEKQSTAYAIAYEYLQKEMLK